MSGRDSISLKRFERNIAIADFIQALAQQNPDCLIKQSQVRANFTQYSGAMVRNTFDYFTDELKILECHVPINRQLENYYTIAENAPWGLVKSKKTDPHAMANARFSYEATAYAHQVFAKAFGLPHINQPHQ